MKNGLERPILSLARLLLVAVFAVPLTLFSAGSQASLAATPAAVTAAAANERITNGTFDSGSANPWWAGANAALRVDSGKLCADVTGGTVNPRDAIIGQNGIVLERGGSYTYTFEWSARQTASIRRAVEIN